MVPNRCNDLVYEFKEIDCDYVNFDLPFLSNISPTLAMAGFVDKVLLVVEAEKSNGDTVKRAYEQLAAANARVSVVFNKSRPYGPKWLECEVLATLCFERASKPLKNAPVFFCGT